MKIENILKELLRIVKRNPKRFIGFIVLALIVIYLKYKQKDKLLLYYDSNSKLVNAIINNSSLNSMVLNNSFIFLGILTFNISYE